MVLAQFGTKDERGQEADWAEAAPIKYEETIISVIVGNSHLHWAMHHGMSDNFVPVLFWRTPPLHADEKADEPCSVLARHLPPQGLELVFGSNETPTTRKAASDTAAERRVPALSIYMVSTSPEHEAGMEFLFEGIPHRLYKLQSKDFFKEEQGLYDTFGVDRAAALYGGICNYAPPVLVLDGGTAFTYSAIDKNRKILGGGISLGVEARFRALSDYCGRLPAIEVKKFQDAIKHAEDNKAPLPVFATDTNTAMMTSIFSEMAGQCRNLVKQFLAAVGGPKEGDDAAGREKATVVVTGGDASVLELFLKYPQPNVVMGEPGTSVPTNEFELKNVKHLIHYGVGDLLKSMHNRFTPKTIEDEIRMSLVGQRIAKQFPVKDDDGEFFYRGTVLLVKKGKSLETGDTVFDEDMFFVRYDDGDAEHLSLKELHDALKMYHKLGEKAVPVIVKWSEEKRNEKKEEAKISAEKLFEKSEKLRKEVEEDEKQREAAIAAGLDPNAVSSAKRGRKSSSASKATPPAKRQKVATPKVKGRPKNLQPQEYIGQRVSKFFPIEGDDGRIKDVLYFGTVDSYNDNNSKLWHITYDDDDEEEYDETDLKRALQLYDKHTQEDPKPKAVVPMEVEEVSPTGETISAATAAPAPPAAPSDAPPAAPSDALAAAPSDAPPAAAPSDAPPAAPSDAPPAAPADAPTTAPADAPPAAPADAPPAAPADAPPAAPADAPPAAPADASPASPADAPPAAPADAPPAAPADAPPAAPSDAPPAAPSDAPPAAPSDAPPAAPADAPPAASADAPPAAPADAPPAAPSVAPSDPSPGPTVGQPTLNETSTAQAPVAPATAPAGLGAPSN